MRLSFAQNKNTTPKDMWLIIAAKQYDLHKTLVCNLTEKINALGPNDEPDLIALSAELSDAAFDLHKWARIFTRQLERAIKDAQVTDKTVPIIQSIESKKTGTTGVCKPVRTAKRK